MQNLHEKTLETAEAVEAEGKLDTLRQLSADDVQTVAGGRGGVILMGGERSGHLAGGG